MAERLKFYWTEYEKAVSTAHQRYSTDCITSYTASYTASVIEMKLRDIIGPNVEVWKWSTEYATRGTVVQAHGYTRTMEAGKLGAENACNRIHAAFLPDGSDKEATKEASGLRKEGPVRTG